MYFEARHVDTLSFVTKAYRDDLTIEAACCAINARNFTIGPGTRCPRRSRETSDNSLSRYDAGTARTLTQRAESSKRAALLAAPVA
jgi:hypothetical protein